MTPWAQRAITCFCRKREDTARFQINIVILSMLYYFNVLQIAFLPMITAPLGYEIKNYAYCIAYFNTVVATYNGHQNGPKILEEISHIKFQSNVFQKISPVGKLLSELVEI